MPRLLLTSYAFAACSAVSKFLHARKELALVPYDKATPTDNVLFMAEMLAPPKEQVLAFLNNTGRKPMRKAFAVLILYKENPPKCMQVRLHTPSECRVPVESVTEGNH